MTATEGGAAPAPVVEVPRTDEIMAATITDTIAGTNLDGRPTELGNAVYSAVIGAIRAERQRGVQILKNLARLGRAEAQKHAGAARVQPDPRRQSILAGIAQSTEIASKTLDGAARLLEQPPGSCQRCGGSGEMLSRLVPGEKVPCSSCRPPGGSEPS